MVVIGVGLKNPRLVSLRQIRENNITLKNIGLFAVTAMLGEGFTSEKGNNIVLSG